MRRREFMAAAIGVPVLNAVDLRPEGLSQQGTTNHWQLERQLIS